MKLIFNKTNCISFVFFFLFVLICILYYLLCNYFFINIPEITNYVNYDHDVYINSIQSIKNGTYVLRINNDIGIALLYTYIIKFFNFVGINDIILISFIFNIFTLFIIYFNYIRVCDKLNLKGFTKFYFFLGLQILYFTQLINKDLLTFLFFLLVLNCIIDKKFRLLLIFSLLFFFVRIQLLIFGFLAIYLSFGNFKKRIFCSYIFTSIFGAITSVKAELLSDEAMGDGFSAFLIQFNKNFYYSGYIIFNPLRVVQFIMDVFMSFFIYTDGLIDIAKILRLPLLIVFFFLFNPIFYSLRNFSIVNKTEIKPVFIIIISFILTWLINPTINARYVMLIVPFFLILGRYVQINRQTIALVNK